MFDELYVVCIFFYVSFSWFACVVEVHPWDLGG